MPNPEDSWLDQAVMDDGLGFWRLDAVNGSFTHRGTLWRLLGAKLVETATLADFGVLVHDDDRAPLFDFLNALIAGRTERHQVRFRLRPHSGSGPARWLEAKGRALERDANGRAKVVVGSLIECSELAQLKLANGTLEQRLSEVSARFHSFLANTREAIWCYECSPPIPLSLSPEEQFERLLEARLVDCNAAYFAQHGAADAEALLGQKLRVIKRARLAVLRPLFEKVVAAGYILEPTKLEAGDRHLIAAAQGIIVEGALVRMWGSHTDVTTKVETEAQNAVLETKLLKAQKMESLGTMAASMAHDFDNVLASILAAAGLAGHAITSGDDLELRQSVKVIKSSAEKGAALTRRWLSLTPLHHAKRRAMRVDLMLHELWPMMRRLIDESILVKLEISEPMWALIDASQLEQIIITLVVNARDAIGPNSGGITVRTQGVVLTEHERKAYPWAAGGPFVELTVTDTGPGLEPSARERIFEPYFTTRPVSKSSTGLGLSMAYGILKQHEGFIDVTSEPGKGAAFRLVLPRDSEIGRAHV